MLFRSVLNSLLSDELTVINQHLLQSEMCASWGYSQLHKAIRKQAIDKMHRVEWLIKRILNDAIAHARHLGDRGTVELLTQILEEEDNHADWPETQPAQIEQMGLENYLGNQMES